MKYYAVKTRVDKILTCSYKHKIVVKINLFNHLFLST